ncbi:hypothetical protein NDQ53_16440 [Rossellomorea marisflavi]|uniref:hypothetical protein n=1 Tax=Rossellomorea marisflavi TaxID=189381 RepID=UPI00203C9FA3|nr:hypothetical protein [Rossellomorea marisflavi]MCM2590892.1 hypothetical protein [Rossellomorea marisflavi]
MAVVAIFLGSTTAFDNAFYRIFESDQAYIGRLGNYNNVMNFHNGSLLGVLFGEGMVEINGFLPAVPRLYIFYGIFGLLAFMFLIGLLIKKRGYKRVVLITMLVSSLGTEIMLGKFILLYLPFIIDFNKNINIFKNNNT